MAKRGRKPREFPNDKATKEWLDSLGTSTKPYYSSHWWRFLEHLKMSGDQILASRRVDSESQWEKHVLGYRQWLKTQKNKKGEILSDLFVRQSTVAIRSFFSFHRVELRFTHGERKRLKEAKPITEDYRFTREDLRKMVDVGDLVDKYVVTAGKSFGLRAGDFLRLTRGHFDSVDLTSEPPTSMGRIYTAKEKVPAYPFIDVDAKTVIKLMLENMDREGRKDPSEPMLRYKDENTLTQILQRLANKAGVKYGNKVVRFHCLRKFLIDRLKNVMPSESAWKQVVGKKISESAYVTEEGLREGYRKAMEETCFTKTAAEGEIELLAKKEALKMLAKMQGFTEDEMKKIFRSKKATTLQDEVQVLEQLTERKTQANGGCADDQHCQRLAVEDELPELLTEGWRVAAVLPSGKVVVER